MASGDNVVVILAVMPPASDNATFDTRAGGSTPAEQVTVYDFDAAADEYLDFKCLLLENYDDGGLEFTLPWSAASATSGQVRWEIGIRRMNDDAEDIDSSHTYLYNGVSDTAPSASGELSYPVISFTDGADMDSWAAGEIAIIRVHRDYDHADDGMSGDAELWGPPIGKEA